MKKINREKAKAAGLKRYFTGEPCEHGHIAERYTNRKNCVECGRAHIRKWRAANPEKCRARGRKDYASNPEKHRECSRKWRVANPERCREHSRKALKTSIGQLRSQCGKTSCALSMGKLDHSRFTLLDYGPDEFIAYLESTLPDGMTFAGAKEDEYHIDHIVPLSLISDALSNDKVGRILAFRMAQDLENLRMIPGTENLSKSASLDMDPLQERVFFSLCKKHGVTNQLLNTIIPYS